MLTSILPTVELFVRMLLALVFAAAAVSKLRNRDEFHGIVRNFKLMPKALDGPFAATLPWVELAIAGTLVLGGSALAHAGAAAGALLMLFALAMVVNILRGRKEIDCGCFRQGLRQGLSWYLVARNMVLAAGALFVAMQPAVAMGPVGIANAVVALAAAVVSLLLYATGVQLQGLRHVTSNKRPLATTG